MFITAHGDESVRPRLLAGGAVECLFKPFSETALLDALNAALRLRLSGDEEHGDVARAPYTGPLAIAARSSEVDSMPDVGPIVFVVDDDVSVRESLELLIRSAGWQPETFASGQDFLARPRHCPLLSGARRDASGIQWPRTAAAARPADGDADHLHHRPR